uniref:Uncharacterized protein n=1 Tax=Rhizophora mucronata TaxID=61149 RepID=A0A2P2K8Y8_RHIMU
MTDRDCKNCILLLPTGIFFTLQVVNNGSKQLVNPFRHNHFPILRPATTKRIPS